MASEPVTTPDLRLIHGEGICHCGKPRAEEGSPFCSYPHARVPVKAVDDAHPEGFWVWEIANAKDNA